MCLYLQRKTKKKRFENKSIRHLYTTMHRITKSNYKQLKKTKKYGKEI